MKRIDEAFVIHLASVLFALVLGVTLCRSVQAARPADHETVRLHETFHISRTCPGSNHWFTEKLEGETITVECDYDPDEGN